MKSLLALPLLAGLVLSSCTKPNPCASNAECAEGQSCNIEEAICEASTPAEADAADVGPACNPDESLCLTAIPEEWSGPVVENTVAAGEEVPACEGEYDDLLALKFSDLQGEGSCDCECGDASGLSCSNATVLGWEGSDGSCELNQCDLTTGGGTCIVGSRSIAPGGCVRVEGLANTADRLRASSFGSLEGGSCGAPTTSEEFEAQFLASHSFCAAEQAEECGADEACPPEPAEGPVCIVQEGVHECPAGDFSERTVVYGEFADNRSCDRGSCSCEAPRGSCGGIIELRAGDDIVCDGVLDTLQPGTGPFNSNENLCDGTTGVNYAEFRPDLDGRSCSASGEGAIAGALEETEPMTVCCTAP